MTVYYIESSALVKRYKSETGSDFVEELFESKVGGELFVTSYLSVLEVNTVAARLLKAKQIEKRQYEQLVASFARDISAYDLVVVPVINTLVHEALERLPDCALRTADALQFSTVIRAKRGAGDQPFFVVSADKEVGQTCESQGLGILDPELPVALEHLRALR
ncbi:MAG: type II toxin-antitoxin system VapC family toxin [Chloroflexi bacterium]|nr:type II toxin-antitoxin system VapC family toxin [Chloroflexota bacterium]